MMGTKARVFAPLPPVSLEDLVPPDHFYRHLAQVLDLGFVRDLVQDAYADTGRPSIDPVIFFKLQLILFFEGLRSERQLLRVVADRLSLRWYLGYDLPEALPDHSSLTRIRERYGLNVFRRFFEAIVEQCIAAGLVWGKELYLDATKVEANAATDSLRPRFAVEAHLAHLFAQLDDDGEDRNGDPDETGADAPAQLPVALTPESHRELAERAAHRHDWIGSAGRPNRNETSGTYRRTADFRISTTDPDATPLPQQDGHTHLGYQDHYVVDGGKARIVLLALVAPAEVQENQPALDLLWRALPLEAAATAGDCRYQVRHGREHHGYWTRAHLRVYALVGLGSAAGVVRRAGFRLRRGSRRLSLSRRADVALPLAVRRDATTHLCGSGSGVHGMLAPRAVHDVGAGATRGEKSRRGVPGAGSRLPRHRTLRQSDAQAASLGRTTLCRSQSVAWFASLPLAWVGAGQRRGAPHCGWPAPEALVESAGMGPPPIPERSCRNRSPSPPIAVGGRLVTAQRGGDLRRRRRGSHAPFAFFNTLDRS